MHEDPVFIDHRDNIRSGRNCHEVEKLVRQIGVVVVGRQSLHKLESHAGARERLEGIDIISAERIISNDEIRSAPHLTVIPSLCVDAVCEVPCGSYPGNMPGEYFSDEEHLREWMRAEKDETTFKAFLQKYIYGVPDFENYLRLCGGMEKIRALHDLELMLPKKG